MKKNMMMLGVAICLSAPVFAVAEPSKALINKKVVQSIRDFVDQDVVMMSVLNQNKKYANLDQEEIIALDNMWRAETKSEDQPLISATLANPLSSYLTRVQAHAIGLYSEMFVMDKNGLNVGQSNISSDYWQGDEAKFQKTYLEGPDAVFIDDPEYDSKLGIWRAQVNLAIADAAGKQAVGAITVEVNLTELERRQAQ